MEVCIVDGCENEINRDGLCFPHKIKTIRFGGLYAMGQQRELGKTGNEIGKENRERFIAEKGYEPVSATERWI